MEDRLSLYLRAEAGRQFSLGRADCVTLVADWVRERRGIDPMASCRGYAAKAEADALLGGWGGLARVVGRGLGRSGLAMTRAPVAGDVAVVAIGDKAACAIRGERRWIVRLDDGLALLSLDQVRVIAAWRV